MRETEIVDVNGRIVELDVYTGEEIGEILQKEYPAASPYSPTKGRIICHLISLGLTYFEIENELELNKGSIMRWRSVNPDFRENLDMARKNRSYIYEDRILKLAEARYESELELREAKFKVDTYSKLAKWGDRETYGDKREESASGVTFIVTTGIDRGENHGGNIVVGEGKTLLANGTDPDESQSDADTLLDNEEDAPISGAFPPIGSEVDYSEDEL